MTIWHENLKNWFLAPRGLQKFCVKKYSCREKINFDAKNIFGAKIFEEKIILMWKNNFGIENHFERKKYAAQK